MIRNRLGRKRKQDEEQTYWLSYSDMMAGLLLCFVLVIALTVLHSNMLYDEKQEQLLGKEQELILQSDELENEKLTVAEQGAKLNAQELKLTEQEGKLAEQAAKLDLQKQKLEEQEALLDEFEGIMLSQQEQMDKIIGIRTELIEALRAEFDSSSLQVAVDEKSGAITMDSTILYEYNKDELKETGKDFLGDFLPRYIHILLSPEYSPYVSEIVIEGHTDTSGTYLFNLDLSQKRAYSVAQYCLDEKQTFLTKEEQKTLQSLLTTSGRSFSDAVLKEDGTIDAAASRRVEILFRLKDEEMIREMVEILNEGGEPGGPASAAAEAGPGPGDSGLSATPKRISSGAEPGAKPGQ